MIGEIYTKDWFGRSESDYIFNENEAMKGIISLPNHKYSSFLYSEDRAERICMDKRLLHKEISGMVNALGLTDVTIRLSETIPTAKTDGKFIDIGIGDQYKSISDCYDKIDRIIGMAIHESCHCLYTDFKLMQSEIGKNPQLVHHIHNVIEDEIIEQKLVSNYPGYGNFLNKLKYNVFESVDDANEQLTELDQVLQLFFYIVRYPKFIAKIDESILNKYEDMFVEIKRVMEEHRCFDIDNGFVTYYDLEASKKIYDILVENIDSANEYNTELPNELREGSEKKSKEQIQKELEDSYTVHILEEVYKILSSESEQLCSKDVYVYHTELERSKEESKDELIWESIPGTSFTNDDDSIRTRDKYDKATYEYFKNEISAYIEQAKRLIIQNKKKTEISTVRFMRNGSLDPTRLANAMCNEQSVFMMKTSKEVNTDAEYALVLSLDESGSMESGNLNQLVSKVAIMILEAVSAYPKVRLFVYGHGDCVYKYYDSKGQSNKYALGCRMKQCGQDEARSYRAIIDDVKKHTNLPIVLFNLTDSCYCTSEEELHKVVESFKNDKQKIYLNLFSFDHNQYTTNNIKEWNDRIYGPGNWVLYNSKIINKALMVGMLKQMSDIIHKNCKL